MTLAEVEEKTKALGLPSSDYALFGSLPLLAHGLIDSVSDIDIVARGAAWTEAQTLAEAECLCLGAWRVSLEDIEIYTSWLGTDADSIIERANFINGLPYAKLQDVLEFKQKLNRPKDAEHIRRIQEYLELEIRN
ncbi:MAG: hypothetical protein ACRCYY_05445 [Trueperaceae bacterium]